MRLGCSLGLDSWTRVGPLFISRRLAGLPALGRGKPGPVAGELEDELMQPADVVPAGDDPGPLLLVGLHQAAEDLGGIAPVEHDARADVHGAPHSSASPTTSAHRLSTAWMSA